MACSLEGVAGIGSTVLDGELVELFIQARATSCSRTGVRLGRTSGVTRRVGRQGPRASEKDRVGTGSSACCFHPRHAPDCGRFSLEFPLAPTLPSRSGSLRRRILWVILATTTTCCRLPPAPAHTHAPARQRRRKNRRRISLATRLDILRARVALVSDRVDAT